MTLEFREMGDDDYQSFEGVEVDDHARIAETNGKLDDDEVTFVIITTSYSMYIIVYPLVVNDPNGDVICEFVKLTSEPRQGAPYKGTSYAQLFDWSCIYTDHLCNIGFDRIDYKD